MVPNPVVSVLVDHADKTMDDVYSHDFEKELVTGAQKVGGFIAKLLGF